MFKNTDQMKVLQQYFLPEKRTVGGCAIELLYSGRGVKSTYYKAARKSAAAAKIECAEKLRYSRKANQVRFTNVRDLYHCLENIFWYLNSCVDQCCL